jgi:hypothetical protein
MSNQVEKAIEKMEAMRVIAEVLETLADDREAGTERENYRNQEWFDNLSQAGWDAGKHDEAIGREITDIWASSRMATDKLVVLALRLYADKLRRRFGS